MVFSTRLTASVWSVLIAAALLSTACEGAALVRFINTVPTRTNQPAVFTAQSTAYRVSTDQFSIDRVGLQYLAPSASGLTSPTEIWTEPLNNRAGTLIGTAPYAWIFGMPPLRQYHTTTVGSGGSTTETAAVDRISTYLTSQDASGRDPSVGDNYEQTFYKADGVSLYLSFAAGTYKVQAYAALQTDATSNAVNKLAQVFTNSLTSLTFVDGGVYTVIAVGNGQYAASPALSGNTVTLSVLQESTAPTTFGMASLRWFHAVSTRSTNTITVSSGGSAVSAAVAFGAVSPYVDVTPNTNYKVSLSINDNSNTVIAPSTASGVETTSDVRAGLRATVICSVADSSVATIFCRMIPSRVVAYIRLINDLAGQSSLVQGAFGSDMLSSVSLNVWGSWEYPRPDQVVESSQTTGSNMTPMSPLLGRGLYGVLTQVSSSTVTGYGEVFVPIIIMDFAVRYTMIMDSAYEFIYGTDLTTVISSSYVQGTSTSPGRRDNQQNPAGYPFTTPTIPTNANNNPEVDPLDWFWGAVIFKRVNLVVKTSGGATLASTPASADPTVSYAVVRDIANVPNTYDYRWYDSAVLLDKYMEPGQYYTLIATSSATGTPSARPTLNIITFYLRLDRTIDQVSSGVSSSSSANPQGIINWVPIHTQDFTSIATPTPTPATVTLRGTGSNNVVSTITLGAATAQNVQANRAWSGWQWNTPAISVQANANSYQFQFTPAVTPPTNGGVTISACLYSMPTPNNINLAAGSIYDVFVLNSFNCMNNQNNVNLLTTAIALTQSSIATGHANNTLISGSTAGPTPGFTFVGAATPAVHTPVLLLSMLFALVIAALF